MQLANRSREEFQMSLDGVPLLLRPGRGKADLLWGCVRRLVSWVKGSMRELRSLTLTSHSFTFSPRAHCCATSWSTWRRSRRSVLFPKTMTVTWVRKIHTKSITIFNDLRLYICTLLYGGRDNNTSTLVMYIQHFPAFHPVYHHLRLKYLDDSCEECGQHLHGPQQGILSGGNQQSCRVVQKQSTAQCQQNQGPLSTSVELRWSRWTVLGSLEWLSHVTEQLSRARFFHKLNILMVKAGNSCMITF